MSASDAFGADRSAMGNGFRYDKNVKLEYYHLLPKNKSFIIQISITRPAKKKHKHWRKSDEQPLEEVRRTTIGGSPTNNNELSPQRETERGMCISDLSQSQVNGPTKAIIKRGII